KTLAGFSKEWEKPLVEDTETRLTAIRREWGHINKALQYIRFAKAAGEATMAADKKGDVDAKSI
ncbi:MAG: conjugative transfer protein MobI(A/C), partial [Pseudomonadota bacterium]